MLQYTLLNNQNIKEIVSPFGFKKVTHIRKLIGGSENTNYFFGTESHSYVLNLFEHKSLNQVNDLAQLLLYLDSHNFKTSQPVLTLDQRLVLKWRNKPVMVKSFFEGKIMDDLPPHVLRLIGKKLGQLHQLAPVDYLPKILPLGYENFHLVNEYAKSSPFSKWLFGIKDYVQPYLDLNLPKALIHSDLFSNNVVVSYDESRITILDFEEATNYYRIFDLGMAIIGLCSVNKIIDAEKLTQLLIGYCQIISLTANEQAALQAFTVYAGASMALWRHRNFNQLHPEMGFKNHFKALQILANFAKNQSPDFFRIN